MKKTKQMYFILMPLFLFTISLPAVSIANCCPGCCCPDPSAKFAKMDLQGVPPKEVIKQARKEVKKIEKSLKQENKAAEQHHQVSTEELCKRCQRHRRTHPSDSPCCPGPCCPDPMGEPWRMDHKTDHKAKTTIKESKNIKNHNDQQSHSSTDPHCPGSGCPDRMGESAEMN